MEQTDLRVIRTKKLIKDAFFSLIEEQGFEGVTVKQLTERAGINRGTFYSHYVDKFELMEKCVNEIFEEAEQKLIHHLPHIFGDERTDKSYHYLVPFIRFIEDNQIIMKPLLGPNGDPTFQAKLRKFMQAALFQRSPVTLFDPDEMMVPPPYLVAYLSSAHMGVIYEWLNNPSSEETAEDIARIIYTITYEGPLVAGGVKSSE
ncbi:MAG: TetR/AcrR family transcriptional regulator [Exiguobacterium sp.]|nr:TetR/AcrR family transcriptional regulator [Exiguobacterium sp.]MBR2757705.1 TetR/AcrR family transcriptional regulator [Exiguobacterium sp.]MBR3060901.1 TetR/AcrR family transcriptional regulator [Exiguobacterium sp.]MBR3216667.1 TetR/AcrR family transcriptional regulator [Exiguobacterium sp.]